MQLVIQVVAIIVTSRVVSGDPRNLRDTNRSANVTTPSTLTAIGQNATVAALPQMKVGIPENAPTLLGRNVTPLTVSVEGLKEAAAISEPTFYATGLNAVFEYALDASTGLAREVQEWSVPDGSFTWGINFQQSDGRKLLGLTSETQSKLLFFDPTRERDSAVVANVDLKQYELLQPVGATFANGKIYTAMFDVNKNGLCVVNASAPAEPVKPHHYMMGHYVHNVVTFMVNGEAEIFINDLGNIWGPITPGNGLVHFDENHGTFNKQTILNLPQGGVHCRSSAQDITDPTKVYLLTQEPRPAPSKLFVLMQNEGAINYTITNTITLPARTPGNEGDGGADVISLGSNQVLVTDRFGSGEDGKMYLYDASEADSVPRQTWTLGEYPRYTGIVGAGAVASAGGDQRVVTYFPGLLQKNGKGYSISADASSIQIKTAAGPEQVSFILATA